MNWTLFVVFLNAAGEPMQYEPLEVYPTKAECIWNISPMQKDFSESFKERQGLTMLRGTLAHDYACVASPPVYKGSLN